MHWKTVKKKKDAVYERVTERLYKHLDDMDLNKYRKRMLLRNTFGEMHVICVCHMPRWNQCLRVYKNRYLKKTEV